MTEQTTATPEILSEDQRKILRLYKEDVAKLGIPYYHGLPDPDDPNATLTIKNPESQEEADLVLDFGMFVANMLLQQVSGGFFVQPVQEQDEGSEMLFGPSNHTLH